jgi:hypothetical protein
MEGRRYTVEIKKACRYLDSCVGTDCPPMQPYQPTRYAGRDAYTGWERVRKYCLSNSDELTAVETHLLWLFEVSYIVCSLSG